MALGSVARGYCKENIWLGFTAFKIHQLHKFAIYTSSQGGNERLQLKQVYVNMSQIYVNATIHRIEASLLESILGKEQGLFSPNLISLYSVIFFRRKKQ